jgi:two-component system cell cycle sensor histidine kinase/response regulator CckA
MSRLADLPIQRKLTFSIVLTCAVTLVLSCGTFVAYDVAGFRRETVEKIASLASVVGSNSTAALEFNDSPSATDTLASLSAEPSIVAACIYTRTGAVHATYYRPGRAPATLPPVAEAGHAFAGDQLRLYRPIMNQGERVGTILLVSDVTELSARVSRSGIIVAAVFGLSLLLAFLLSKYFDRLITQPVLKLAALTHRVGTDRSYAMRARKESNDEVGQLIEGFNHMLAQIEARDAELQQAHALMEQRVEDRTTALQQAQDAAIREHARFKLIFDTVPVGICLRVLEADGRLTLRLLNRAHLRLCDLTPAQAEEPRIFERISHPDDYVRQLALTRQLDAGLIREFSLEKRYLTPAGRTVWVVYSLQRRELPDGTREELSTVVDITERKTAELEQERTGHALRASEEKFSRAFRTHPDSISICRVRDDVLLEVNPGFTQLTGYSATEAIGQSALPGDLNLWVEPKDRLRLVQALQQNSAAEVETKIRRRDGAVLTCSISASLMEVGGEPCMLAISRDLTAQRRMEAQLAHSGKLEAIGQLAGGVAHDYNNILTAKLLQLELLLNLPGIDPEIHSAHLELKHMADRSAALTRQLLAFSRQQVVQIKSVELNEVVVHLLRMLSRLLGENIQVTFQGTADQLWLDADVGMLEQAVTNLCVNARDAMPAGGHLTIGTARVVLPADIALRNPEASPGIFACLSVTDTGCGMDATTLQHIFEPFFTTKEVGKGTGLGLATVYGITKQHRGWIEVQSEVGQGSTFRAFFPLSGQAPAAALPAPSRPSAGGQETILLVEDEALVRSMMVATLKRSGYRLIEAADGAEAIRCWEAHSSTIGLVISDMVMPNGYTGLDLAKRFQRDRPGLKMIITSGYSVDLRDSGAPAESGLVYLAKPFEVGHLQRLVRECLDGA